MSLMKSAVVRPVGSPVAVASGSHLRVMFCGACVTTRVMAVTMLAAAAEMPGAPGLNTMASPVESIVRVMVETTRALAQVAPGIAEALVATAMGLFAAIPAVVAYNRFAGDVNRLATRFESFIEEFSNILQRQANV